MKHLRFAKCFGLEGGEVMTEDDVNMHQNIYSPRNEREAVGNKWYNNKDSISLGVVCIWDSQ